MSLYGPTFHVTLVELCIIFQCNLYISCIMSCENKIVLNCFNFTKFHVRSTTPVERRHPRFLSSLYQYLIKRKISTVNSVRNQSIL